MENYLGLIYAIGAICALIVTFYWLFLPLTILSRLRRLHETERDSRQLLANIYAKMLDWERRQTGDSTEPPPDGQ